MTRQGYERRLSERDRKRIIRTLPLREEGCDLATLLARVEYATQEYWAQTEEERTPTQIASDLAQVKECATRLLRAIDLLNSRVWHDLERQLPRGLTEFDHVVFGGITRLSMKVCWHSRSTLSACAPLPRRWREPRQRTTGGTSIVRTAYSTVGGVLKVGPERTGKAGRGLPHLRLLCHSN